MQCYAVGQMFDAFKVANAAPADDAMNVIVLLEEEFGKIRSILSSDSRNQRRFCHPLPAFLGSTDARAVTSSEVESTQPHPISGLGRSRIIRSSQNSPNRGLAACECHSAARARHAKLAGSTRATRVPAFIDVSIASSQLNLNQTSPFS